MELAKADGRPARYVGELAISALTFWQARAAGVDNRRERDGLIGREVLEISAVACRITCTPARAATMGTSGWGSRLKGDPRCTVSRSTGPDVNRLQRSYRCWVCGTDLEAALRRATEPVGNRPVDMHLQLESLTVQARQSVSRQIENGMCDQCQRLRQGAAIEYERAAYEMRMVSALGARWHGRGVVSPELSAAMRRCQDADARCVELKMWPAERSTARPVRYYREES